MYIDILCRLRDAVRIKRPENGNTTFGFSLTTMLQHTGRFWSRIIWKRAMWRHWSIPHTLLTSLQLIFTFPFDWNQHWRDGAFVMLRTSLTMQGKSWKGLHIMASRKVSSTFTVAGRNLQLRKGLFWRTSSFNYCDVLSYSKIEWLRRHFEAPSISSQYFTHLLRNLIYLREGLVLRRERLSDDKLYLSFVCHNLQYSELTLELLRLRCREEWAEIPSECPWYSLLPYVQNSRIRFTFHPEQSCHWADKITKLIAFRCL